MSVPFRPVQTTLMSVQEYEERCEATTRIEVARLLASGKYQRHRGAKKLALSFRLLLKLAFLMVALLFAKSIKSELASKIALYRNSPKTVPDVEANGSLVYGPFRPIGPFLPPHEEPIEGELTDVVEIGNVRSDIAETKEIRELYWLLVLGNFCLKTGVSLTSYNITKFILNRIFRT